MFRAFAEFDGRHLMNFSMRAQFPFKSPVSTNFTTRAAAKSYANRERYTGIGVLVLPNLPITAFAPIASTNSTISSAYIRGMSNVA